MPSLFNRRSRSVSTSRPTTSASSSAHLAAAQAFLASQPSQSNLSASAAAAALRTMSPTPTPVDQVQTKRMLDRQASNSSMASAPRGRSRGTVQRKLSSGSMTERTFRSPSPGQQASRAGPGADTGKSAPPVPPLPRYSEDLPRLPVKSHRRSASMDVPPRISSPPPLRTAARGQNVTTTPPVNNLAAAAARRSTGIQPPPAPEMKRSDSQDSRNSINFSYPRGSRPSSPPPRSPLSPSNEGLPATASIPKTTTNGISAAEAARIQSNLTQTAAKPVKKKKKQLDQSTVEGSHLRTGTMGAKPTVTPLEALPADYEQPPTAQPVKKVKKKAALTGESSHFPDSPDPVGAASESDAVVESPPDKRAQRASGILMKQPSVVREDWEGEQEQQSSPAQSVAVESKGVSSADVTTPTQSKRVTPAANMSRKIEEPSSGPKSPSPSGVYNVVTVSAPQNEEITRTLSPANVAPANARGTSTSPSRSKTRFSDRLASDLASGRKHEPLGRSMSPAKSALKHHNIASETSPTDSKFPQRRASSQTPSEASDASAEGSSRKKSTRVSFEGYADVKDSLADVRASKETNRKSWLGMGKGKSSNLSMASTSEDDLEEGMKPRPALPSFGSVRRNERSDPVTSHTRSASSSETSSIADPPTMDTSISSDHALGGLLARDSQKNISSGPTRTQEEPLPPNVRSVEGTGYESDSESAYSNDGHSFDAARNASEQLGKSIGEGTSLTKDEIPVIAVQPATPGLDESRSGEDWGIELPGGFPASGGSSDVSVPDTNETYTSSTKTTTTAKDDTGLGLTDASHNFTSPTSREPSAGSSPLPLMTIEEEDSDNSSVYSDAAEEMDGDGFGSINAIVESPHVPPTVRHTNPILESPLAAVSQRRPNEATRTASWDDTQAHWSGLAQLSREVKQQAVQPTAEVTTPPTAAEPSQRSKAVAAPMVVASKAPVAKPKSAPAKKSQSVPAAKARVAMQPSPTAVVATKQASAPKTQGQFRSSMRGAPEPGFAQSKSRPASYATPSSPPRVAMKTKAAAPTAVPQSLPRRFSNDSDSDSSFKKARRRKPAAEGKFTMKRSMRTAAEPAAPPAPSGRAGVRSLSPPANRRPMSPMGGKPMRTTMRGSVDLGTPTLRPQIEKRSSSLFSRNRTAKSPTRPASAVLPNKLKSRLADSDDEGESRPTHFKSRFADSDDEDEPQPLRPVRGIPRKNDDVDSTDLDDSSEEEGRKRKATAPKKLAIIPPPPNQEIASPPLSPTTAKKRGLWSRLRGKKKEDESQPSASNTILQRESSKEDVDADKGESKNAKNLGFNSAAERDALIEQTMLKLEGSKDRPQSPVAGPQVSNIRPQSPNGKLIRRHTPQRVFSDSLLAPRMPATVDDRPQTADGVDQLTRPGAGSRQPTSEKLNGEPIISSKTGKKKKFGFLRKAFGLND